MKKILGCAALAAVSLLASQGASAQIYEIANQIPQLLQPALSGSASYKGFVEASYVQGVGNDKVNSLELTTTQGFNYSNWFFMGVGAGANVAFSRHWDDILGGYPSRETSTYTIVPLYTDFRFNIGNTSAPSFFVDMRVGCAFLVGSDEMELANGYVTNKEYFYFRPTIGVRIPASSKSPKQAINIGLSYQLLTARMGYYDRNITLNGLGAGISFEW